MRFRPPEKHVLTVYKNVCCFASSKSTEVATLLCSEALKTYSHILHVTGLLPILLQHGLKSM